MLLAGDAAEGGQVSDWTDEVRARMVREEERLRYKAANLQARGKTVMAAQELAVADDICAALAEVERLTNKLNADSQNFEIECLSSEVERLKHLIFVWRQASYSGTPDEYQRAAVDLEDEALRIGVTRAGPKHSKHPTGDYCVYCRSQWPCEESGVE